MPCGFSKLHALVCPQMSLNMKADILTLLVREWGTLRSIARSRVPLPLWERNQRNVAGSHFLNRPPPLPLGLMGTDGVPSFTLG